MSVFRTILSILLISLAPQLWANSSCVKTIDQLGQITPLQLPQLVDRLKINAQIKELRVIKSQRIQEMKNALGSFGAAVQTRTAINILYSKKISSVLYPASGYDSGIPFIVFADATLIVGMDNHPFVEKTSEEIIPAKEFSETYKNNWEVAVEIDREKTVAAKLLSSLLATQPNIRIKRVLSIVNLDGVHGIIEFDNGEGTDLKKYVHVQLPFGRSLKISHSLQVDALFIKAAMGIYIERTFFNNLSRHGALIVNGDGDYLSLPFKGKEVINLGFGGLGYHEVQLIKLDAPSP